MYLYTQEVLVIEPNEIEMEPFFTSSLNLLCRGEEKHTQKSWCCSLAAQEDLT